MKKRLCKKELRKFDEYERLYWDELHEVYELVRGILKQNSQLSDDDIEKYSSYIAITEATRVVSRTKRGLTV